MKDVGFVSYLIPSNGLEPLTKSFILNSEHLDPGQVVILKNKVFASKCSKLW